MSRLVTFALKQLIGAVGAVLVSVTVLVAIDALLVLARELAHVVTDGVARELVLATDAIPDAVAAVPDVHAGVIKTSILFWPTSEK